MPTHTQTRPSQPDVPAPTVTKTGNLAKEPELGFGQERGTPYVRLRLAVNEPKVPGDWRGEQNTEFFDVTCFGSLAENVAESLTKGTRVLVTGRLETEAYAGSDGTERERLRIIADGLGPDLRWATAEVRRTSRTAPRAETGTGEG